MSKTLHEMEEYLSCCGGIAKQMLEAYQINRGKLHDINTINYAESVKKLHDYFQLEKENEDE